MTERVTDEQIAAWRHYGRTVIDIDADAAKLEEAVAAVESERARVDDAERDRFALRRNLVEAQRWSKWFAGKVEWLADRFEDFESTRCHCGDDRAAAAVRLTGIVWASRRKWQDVADVQFAAAVANRNYAERIEARILALHRPSEGHNPECYCGIPPGAEKSCLHCRMPWPCETVQIVQSTDNAARSTGELAYDADGELVFVHPSAYQALIAQREAELAQIATWQNRMKDRLAAVWKFTGGLDDPALASRLRAILHGADHLQ